MLGNQISIGIISCIGQRKVCWYDLKPIADGRTLQLAKPEKTLLDLLYLYFFYNTTEDLEELRLDEDCKDLSKADFIGMTDAILQFLQRNGMRVEVRDKKNDKLKAFRRNIHFPELLFDLSLTGHKDERFLIKVSP